jgi:hypothetical protein
MAKFYGKIGYGISTVEKAPGVWDDVITELIIVVTLFETLVLYNDREERQRRYSRLTTLSVSSLMRMPTNTYLPCAM